MHAIARSVEITIEPLTIDQAASAVEEVFEAMSPEARFHRYLQATPRLRPGMVAALTSLDPDRHRAVVARVDGRPIGLARVVRDATGSVELAVEVADRYAGRGIGAQLTRRALELAADWDVDHAELLVHPENHRAVRLFRRLGARFRYEDGVLVGSLPIRTPAAA